MKGKARKIMKRILSLTIALLMIFSVFSTLAIPASAGDSIATATPVSFNKTYSGEISASTQNGVYKFTLPSSGSININSFAYIEATTYALYNSNGACIWYDNCQYRDNNSGVCARDWTFDLNKGTYYFSIKPYSNHERYYGSYNFKITFKSYNETFSEPQGGNNQTIDDADEVFFDETINGQLASTDDRDIFKFTLANAGKVTMKLKAYIYKTDFYLYNAEGNMIWSCEDQYRDEASKACVRSWDFDLNKGTYYFAVVRDDGTGNYNFKMTYKKASESFAEPQGGNNQIIDKADKISLNKTYKGQIALTDDRDFYKFTLPTSGKIKVKLTAYIYKTDLYLYDANGTAVWSKTNQTWNDASKKYTLSEEITLNKGTYYFAVVRNNGTGNYTFSINCTHKWSRTVNKKATTSADGNGTKTCAVCKTQSTYTIPKIKSIKLSRTAYTYDGNTKKPTVIVKDSKGNELKSGTDYTVKYSSGRKNVGQYTVTVTFKGKYSGSKKLTFKINPKGTRIATLTAGAKKFTVKVNKQSTQTTGYQIQYSRNSSMSSSSIKTYVGTSTTSRTVSGLKARTTYYVRVRTYKNVKINGETVRFYSSWSSVKSVKTK